MPETNLASADETRQAGRELAAGLPAFAVLVLTGPLGAGKTTLMQGLAEGLGVADAREVTSPSYTLVHEYRRQGRVLLHLDLYRLDTTAQFATLGLDDIFTPPDAAAGELSKCVAVEWGEKLERELARPYLRLELAANSSGGRRLRRHWIT